MWACEAISALASGGLHLALTADAFAGVLFARADDSRCGWGPAFYLALARLLPLLASSFPEEVERAISQEREQQRRPASGKSGSGRQQGKSKAGGGDRDVKPGAAMLVAALLAAWRACLSCVASLREQGRGDVQACVDALEGALAVALWSGMPAFSAPARQLAESVAEDRRGTSVALPARVLQAVSEAEQVAPDREAPERLARAGGTPHGPTSMAPPSTTFGGALLRPREKENTPAANAAPPSSASRKRPLPGGRRSDPFAASQTEYVRIPQAPAAGPKGGHGRPSKRAQGLVTYTSLDASQAQAQVDCTQDDDEDDVEEAAVAAATSSPSKKKLRGCGAPSASAMQADVRNPDNAAGNLNADEDMPDILRGKEDGQERPPGRGIPPASGDNGPPPSAAVNNSDVVPAAGRSQAASGQDDLQVDDTQKVMSELWAARTRPSAAGQGLASGRSGILQLTVPTEVAVERKRDAGGGSLDGQETARRASALLDELRGLAGADPRSFFDGMEVSSSTGSALCGVDEEVLAKPLTSDPRYAGGRRSCYPECTD